MGSTENPLETTRHLLDREASLRHGFLDVLGESVASETPTVAQVAMNSPLVATVYERLWRPVLFYVASGVTTSREQRRAADALDLSGTHRLLDIACGPGNFTGKLAQVLPADGLAVSSTSGEGLGALVNALAARAEGLLAGGDAPIVTRERHRAALEECVACLARAIAAHDPALVGEDLRLAVRALGRITGGVDVEDLLDVIFRDFCIGK